MTPPPAPQPTATDSIPSQGLPLFYSQLLTLSADTHAGRGLLPATHHGFTRTANAIPVGVGEFAALVRHYPIVFTGGTGLPVPVALTGLVEGSNLFVDAQGRWRAGAYIPGYVRRHPFWLQATPDGRSAMLAIDAGSERFVALVDSPSARPLFEADGGPGEAAREAMDFCRLAYEDEVRTGAFARALLEQGLLVENQAQFTLPDGRARSLRGFRVVDEQAFRKLPDAVVREWFRHGWLDAVTLHLTASHNWATLMEWQTQRYQESAGAAAGGSAHG